MSEDTAPDLDSLTDSQRRCVWSVGRFGFWDTQAQRYRRECIDLGLLEWRDGAKLTASGREVFHALVALSETTGTYLNVAEQEDNRD